MSDAQALMRDYAFLDDCPDALFDAVVTLPIGALDARMAGTATWRAALLAGALPTAPDWPPPAIASPALEALSDLGLQRFTRDNPELTDAVMRDVLHAFERQAPVVHADVLAHLRELEALAREGADPDLALDPAHLAELAALAKQVVHAQAHPADIALTAAWAQKARAWQTICAVFDDLGVLFGRGWDLSLGVLRHVGWTDLVRLQALVAKLPEVTEIVRSLGRLQASDDGPCETIFAPVTRQIEQVELRPTPRVPTEMRGVTRSDSVARMLPAEAMLLSHPKLRMLWHARRAEHGLLNYRVEGVEAITETIEITTQEETEAPRPQRGPIIAIIDTSGSMHGLPERVAKAVVLEAMRTAHRAGRRCFLYAYSGPGQTIEHELGAGTNGIGRLLDFLALSFGGGSDEIGVLTRVLDRLDTDDWHRADVVFVSDGEWPAPRAVLNRVCIQTERGTRFHGVQIGNRGRTGLHAVCDPVHEFQSWAALNG